MMGRFQKGVSVIRPAFDPRSGRSCRRRRCRALESAHHLIEIVILSRDRLRSIYSAAAASVSADPAGGVLSCSLAFLT